MDYLKQAKDFLQKTSTNFEIEFVEYGYHFKSDDTKRDIYKVTLKRGNRVYSFRFGQSIARSGFFVQQGRKKTYLDRKYLELSDTKIWANRLRFNLETRVSNDKIIRPTAPNEYDVLACLTKYDPESLGDFCGTYGYYTDTISTLRAYKSVLDEWKHVCMLWSDDEIDLLQEIQ